MTTIREYLVELSNKTTTTQEDDVALGRIFRQMLGVSSAVVTCGCVYISPPCPPCSIQQGAKMVLKIIEEHEAKVTP